MIVIDLEIDVIHPGPSASHQWSVVSGPALAPLHTTQFDIIQFIISGLLVKSQSSHTGK